jgi:hypothetical protein
MSASCNSSKAKGGQSKAAPKRIVQLFLGTLISLLLTTLVLGQLNVPYIGITLWDLGLAAIASGFDSLCNVIPVLADATASNYTVITGAVGVCWLTHTYFRIRRLGTYRASGFVDSLMAVASLWLLVIYIPYEDKTLPLHASFFSRLALFCAISPVVFCWMVLVGYLANINSEREKDMHDGWMTVFIVSLLGSVAVGIVTGFRGGSDTDVSFIAYQAPNAVLHLLANLGGIAMGMWFLSEVEESEGGRHYKKPASAEAAAAGSATTGGH